MIVVSAKNTAMPGMREKFIQAAQAPTAATRKEKGCIRYTLYASAENEVDLLCFEIWETTEDLANHLSSAHMREFFAVQKDQGLLDMEKKVVTKYEVV